MATRIEDLTPDEIKALSPQERSLVLDALVELESKASQKQRLRTLGQGATFSFGEEIEAGLRAPFSEQTYPQIRDELRGQLAQYRENEPLASTGYEFMGAIAPAVLSRGRTAPLSLTQIAGRSALEGGIAGYGASEGDFLQQLQQTATGAVAGGVLGTGMQKGLEGLGAVAKGAVNWVRSKMGSKGANIVENEILRLAEVSGETPDEIVARIARGEIMGDNATLREALRAYYAKGDANVRRQLDEVLPQRAESTRLEGVAAIKSGLAPETGENVLQTVKMNEEAFRRQESNAYNRIFAQGQEVPSMVSVLEDAVSRVRAAGTDLNEIYGTTKGNLVPPFKVNEAGAIEWVRVPTLEDAEIIRRGIADATDTAFRGGKGSVGKNLKQLENDLRGEIDNASPELASTRANWRQMNALRENYEAGFKAFNMPSEALELEWKKIADNDDLAQAFREGVMSRLNDKMSRGGRKSLLGKLANDETLEGKLFSTVFPEEMQDDALTKLLTASKAQETANRVLGGSQTAATLLQADRVGMGISGGDMFNAMRGDPIALGSIVSKVVRDSTQMSDKEMGQVVDILVSQDADLVRRALTDDTAMGELQRKIAQYGQRLTGRLSGASAITGGAISSENAGAFGQ